MGDRLAETYREFAPEAPLCTELGTHFAEDRALLDWLRRLPAAKRQPNLVVAAYRLAAGTPSGWPEFEQTLEDRRDEVEAVTLERRTRTNEARALRAHGCPCSPPSRSRRRCSRSARAPGCACCPTATPPTTTTTAAARSAPARPPCALTRDGVRVAYADGHGGSLGWG